MKFILHTPVLLLIFNRPDTTAQVFGAIRQAKPKRLFIAADGPREDKPEEIDKCNLAKQIVSKIDWDCEVKTLFREKNLGCRDAVSSAISWFFDHVEDGIILEDDCLPEQSFFQFCQKMLEQYRHCTQIKYISGTNYLFSKYDHFNSYYFSDFGMIWGWATWKRTWQEYSLTFEGYELVADMNLLHKKYRNNKEIISWLYAMIEATRAGILNTWDVQLFYLLIKKNGLTIVPLRNQIKNIGYIGTHSVGVKHPFFEMPTKPLSIDTLISPEVIRADSTFDDITYQTIIKYNVKGSLLNQFRSMLPSSMRSKYRALKKIMSL